jgi:hypothetical protein
VRDYIGGKYHPTGDELAYPIVGAVHCNGLGSGLFGRLVFDIEKDLESFRGGFPFYLFPVRTGEDLASSLPIGARSLAEDVGGTTGLALGGV